MNEMTESTEDYEDRVRCKRKLSTLAYLTMAMGVDVMNPRSRPAPKINRCIMCGEPRKDGLFCDGSIPFLSGKSCKETYRADPEYWDKQCKY